MIAGARGWRRNGQRTGLSNNWRRPKRRSQSRPGLENGSGEFHIFDYRRPTTQMTIRWQKPGCCGLEDANADNSGVNVESTVGIVWRIAKQRYTEWTLYP